MGLGKGRRNDHNIVDQKRVGGGWFFRGNVKQFESAEPLHIDPGSVNKNGVIANV